MNQQSMDKKLADMLLKAMEYRESSYDKTAAAAETAQMEARAAADPEDVYGVDYASLYGMTLGQAADKAATEAGEPSMASILYYLMLHSWNDVQAWIKQYKLA